MSNDIGMIKAVPQVGQSHATASPGDSQSAVVAGPADAAAEAREGERSKPLGDVVSDLNNLVRELHRELQFSVDDNSGETVIKVIDMETDEVVRQIPSEELMHLRKRLQEAAGVIFHDSA